MGSSEREIWDRSISHVEKQSRVPQAVMLLASMLADLGVRPPSSMESAWIHWEGRGWLRARWSSGTVLFSWDSDVESAQFSGISDAMTEVARRVGKRKPRSKRTKNEAE